MDSVGSKMADRHGPLRTPIGWFVERVNGGAISEGAAVAYGDKFGIDTLPTPFLENVSSISGGYVSVLAPTGVRRGDQADPNDVLVFLNSKGFDTETVSVRDGNVFEASAGEVFPSRPWLGDGDGGLTTTWLNGDVDGAFDKSTPLLLATGDRSLEEVFGEQARATGNNPFDTGNNPFDTGNNPFLVVAPGNVVFGDGSSHVRDVERLLDASRPAPLGGGTFGLGVLSTPNASVAGQSANPLVDVETKELLQREEAREMLKRAGVTDADEVEWLAGPKVAYREGKDPDFVTELLGSETAIESFTGVVSGREGPWWTGVHVARSSADDHVIAAGVQRAPLGTAKAAAKKGDTTLHMPVATTKGDTTLFAGREYMVSVVERLAIE
jgi:hypothetical protein